MLFAYRSCGRFEFGPGVSFAAMSIGTHRLPEVPHGSSGQVAPGHIGRTGAVSAIFQS